MSFLETLKTAWEGMTVNKLRSFLTTLGIIIGVASVIIMMAVSAGAEAVIAEQIQGLGANLIIVNPMRGVPGAGRTLLYKDALAIGEQVKGIAGISAEQITAPQAVKSERETLELIVTGATPDYPGVRDVTVAAGRFFDQKDLDRKNKVVVLGAGIAQDLFGDGIALGQRVNIGTTRYKVIGVMAEKGTVGDVDYDGQIYIPITVLFQKYLPSPLANDRLRTIYIEAESKETMDNTILQIKNLMAKQHNVTLEKADFVVQTQQDIISTQEATTEAFRSLLAWVAGVSLLVGGIGIMNIMLVSVTERTREIGVRQSLGATPGDIRLQFLIEAVALSLIGGLVGVLGGIGGSILFGELGDMRTVIVPLSIPLSFAAAAAVGIFFGYFPANSAAKLDPIEALRHE
ncbi:MAG: ABC transporter permease [Anaerolineae bacterium]